MKLLFENWREYLNERINGGPPPKRAEYDIGTAFPKINVQDIIESPAKKAAVKIALLNIFNQLEAEVNESNIKHILYSLYTMSGNSPDFDFTSRDEALKFYMAPYSYKARPEDSKPTKSLKDWHNHLKVINNHPTNAYGWVDRGKKITDFYALSDKQNLDIATVDNGVVSPTIVAPRQTIKK